MEDRNTHNFEEFGNLYCVIILFLCLYFTRTKHIF